MKYGPFDAFYVAATAVATGDVTVTVENTADFTVCNEGRTYGASSRENVALDSFE